MMIDRHQESQIATFDPNPERHFAWQVMTEYQSSEVMASLAGYNIVPDGVDTVLAAIYTLRISLHPPIRNPSSEESSQSNNRPTWRDCQQGPLHCP
eukprot:3185607-Pyramimonas_sp.AAC.1